MKGAARLGRFALCSTLRERRLRPGLLFAVIVLALAACVGDEEPAGPQRQRGAGKAAVRVEAVAEGSIHHRLEVVGELTARRSVDVASRIAGRVTEVLVELGEDVGEGDLLVQLDDGPLRSQVLEAQAAWKVAKASVTRAGAEHRAAESELRRKAPLADDDLVTPLEMDNLRSRFDATSAALEVARAQADGAAARLKKLRQDLADTRLSAPFPGRIAARHLDPGAVVSPGTPILELVHTDPAVARFQLSERQVGLVRTRMSASGGPEVTLELNAYPDRRWTGRLVRLSPSLRAESRAAAAEAEFDNPEGLLMPGMFCRLTLDLGGSERAVLVPSPAVLVERVGERRTTVFVVRGGKAHQVEVRLGLEQRGQTEVLDGLSPGDQVVVEGQARLRDGQEVQVVTGSAGERNGGAPGGNAAGAKRR